MIALSTSTAVRQAVFLQASCGPAGHLKFICRHSRRWVRTSFAVSACASSEVPIGQRSHTTTEECLEALQEGSSEGREKLGSFAFPSAIFCGCLHLVCAVSQTYYSVFKATEKGKCLCSLAWKLFLWSFKVCMILKNCKTSCQNLRYEWRWMYKLKRRVKNGFGHSSLSR